MSAVGLAGAGNIPFSGMLLGSLRARLPEWNGPVEVAIIRMVGGEPDLLKRPPRKMLYFSKVAKGWGVFKIPGEMGELVRLNNDPAVYRICLLNELDAPISEGRRARINEWLSLQGWALIPKGWCYQQVIDHLHGQMKARA